MKLSGSYKLNLKKEVVWKALNDPNILKKCIPGCETFDKRSIHNTFFHDDRIRILGDIRRWEIHLFRYKFQEL